MKPDNEKPEPVAWVTPRLFGQKVTFYKPRKPEGFDDNEAGIKWYCRPLVYGDTQPQSAGVPEFKFDEWWDQKARYIDHRSTRALARAAYKAGFGETYSATTPQPAGDLREVLHEAVASMPLGIAEDDNDTPTEHIYHAIKPFFDTTPQPAGGWLYREPDHGEEDYCGQVWTLDANGEVELLSTEDCIAEFKTGDECEIIAFQPTGLKRPQPPREQAGRKTRTTSRR